MGQFIEYLLEANKTIDFFEGHKYLETALNEYISNLTNTIKNSKAFEGHYGISYQVSKKYIKVWKTCDLNSYSDMIICFIDKFGNMYKPAGTSKPAEGVRMHLDENPDAVNYIGAFYNRRDYPYTEYKNLP